MDIRTAVQNNISTISLKGRFDFAEHLAFSVAVRSLPEDSTITEIKVNLSDVDYLDSSALGMLLQLREKAKVAGKTVSLAGATGSVKNVLKIANFEKLFPVK
ncbi:MAG: STAS domain-containing protein [Sterolibacterium sp.]